MFPVEQNGDNTSASSGDKPAAVDPRRPAFSLPLMTNNFRRFNARQVTLMVPGVWLFYK